MLTNEAAIRNPFPGLINDLIQEVPLPELARGTDLGEATIIQLYHGKRLPSYAEAWRIVSACYKFGVFEILPAHGIAPVTFDISAPFSLLKPPIGVAFPPPTVRLRQERTNIAGYSVDFPLGVPASILSANWQCIEFYAQRGFTILTYKTVRTRKKRGHEFPNWVFLENPREIVNPSNTVVTGSEGFWPEDITTISMANSFGIPSFAPDWWQEDIQRSRRVIKEGQVLIVSVVSSVKEGDKRDIVNDFVAAARMAQEAGAQIIEANYSCPNVKGEHHDIYQDPSLSSEISKALSTELDLYDTPLFVKIGHLPEPKLREFVKANAKFIRGITAINTISAKVVNSKGEQTFPGPDREKAGVSGWAIKARAQEVARNLVALRQELKLGDDFVLLGLGGVLTKEDYEERMATGVTAVESCTGAFLNPNLGVDIRQLDTVLRESTVETERSSATSEKQERIGEDLYIHTPLEGRADETPSGGPSMKKYLPQAPGSRLAQGVDMGKLFARAVKLAETISADEVDATLRDAREEYLRRSPNNVPPYSDD